MPHCAPGAVSPHSLRGLSRPSRNRRRRHPRVPRFLSRLPLIVREPSVINLLDLPVVVVVVVVVRRALDVTQRLRGQQCTVGHDGYNFTAWPGRASQGPSRVLLALLKYKFPPSGVHQQVVEASASLLLHALHRGRGRHDGWRGRGDRASAHHGRERQPTGV